MSSIKTRIKQRIDTLSNWISVNPTLLPGELAIVTFDDDSIKIKIGDKLSSKFNDLKYIDDNKIQSQDGLSGEISAVPQLTIYKLDSKDYYDLILNDKIDQNGIYIVSSENFNGYNKQIQNVSDGVLETDVATVGQLNSISSDLDIKISTSNTSLQTSLNELQTSIDNTQTSLNNKSGVVIRTWL